MKAWFLVIALLLTGAMGCSAVNPGSEDEREIPLSEVPAEALQAARGAVDGIALTEAEVETEDGQTVYIVDGTANGVEYEIEVSADGRVLEVEQEGEDDDEDGDEADDEDQDEDEDEGEDDDEDEDDEDDDDEEDDD